MKLIIGLGNPGEKYENTRHNFGFKVVEKIAEKGGVDFRNDTSFESRLAEMGPTGNQVKLIEPQTFMNDSGRAVIKIKNYFRTEKEDVWVIHDDVDLDFGKVRVSFGGKSAGHKGVQSVIDNIDEGFWRIRIGVGKPTSPVGGDEKIPTEDWVLKNFSKDDEKELVFIIDKVADLVIEFVSLGISEQTITI